MVVEGITTEEGATVDISNTTILGKVWTDGASLKIRDSQIKGEVHESPNRFGNRFDLDGPWNNSSWGYGPTLAHQGAGRTELDNVDVVGGVDVNSLTMRGGSILLPPPEKDGRFDVWPEYAL